MDPVTRWVKMVVGIVLVLVLGAVWLHFANKATAAEAHPQRVAVLGCVMHGMPCPSWAAMKAEQYAAGKLGHTRAGNIDWTPRVERLLTRAYQRSHVGATRRGVLDWLERWEKHVVCGVATYSYVGDGACYRALSAVTERDDKLDAVLHETNGFTYRCGGNIAIGVAVKPWAGWVGIGASVGQCFWNEYAQSVQ